MNLIIDQGNTLFKYALFAHNEILQHGTTESISAINDCIIDYLPQVDKGIYSSVGSTDFHTVKTFFSTIGFMHLTHKSAVPIENKYRTPQTLGLDRLAAAVGGNTLFPDTELLIIDAGSAITYEYVSAQSAYLGGNISPGLRMRFKALHTFTHKLPLLTPLGEATVLGFDTDSAIRAGVENGMLYEVQGVISVFKKRHPNGKVILTGGDSPFFDKRLKSSIFATAELVLIGLNRILNYTIEKSTI